MLCELFTSFQCLLAALSPRYKMLVILYLKHVYYVSHLDIVSYPLVVLCGMIVTLLDSSVFFCCWGSYVCFCHMG